MADNITSSGNIDWAKAFGGISKAVSDVAGGVTKQREELDQLQRDNEILVDSYEPGKSQTLREFTIRAASDIKNQMKSWNDELKAGRLRPDEYKRRMENVKEYWGILANSAKTFDQRYQDTMARQNPDENGRIPASAFEMELLERFGQMADIGNNSAQVGTDGRLYMVKKNEKGEIVGDIMDIRTMNSPENIVSDRINVASGVASLTENWQPWSIWRDSGMQGEVNITDIRENKQVFGPMKAQVAETLAPDSNPRAQISVLVDNGVMDASYYINDAEYKQMRQAAIDRELQLKKTAGLPEQLTPEELKRIEFNLVKIEKDARGVINPVLTEEQKKAAKDRVMQEVEIQLGRKVEGTPRRVDFSNNKKSSNDTDAGLYKRLADAWKSGDSDTLNSYLKNQTAYKVAKSKKNPGQYALYKISKNDLTGETEETEEMSSSSLEDFIPYYFGTGAAAEKRASEQMEAYKSQGSSGSKSTPKKFN